MLRQRRRANGRLPAILLIAFCFALDFPIAAESQAQEPFYQGKTIRIVVGLPAGDVYDIWARILANHMGRNIPGKPNIIVQNMTGAATMIAANHVYSVGKPDGLTFGMIIPSIYFDQLLSRKEVQFDYSKFTWIGSTVKGEQQMYMRADAPYKTVEDVRKASVWLTAEARRARREEFLIKKYSELCELCASVVNTPSQETRKSRKKRGYDGRLQNHSLPEAA